MIDQGKALGVEIVPTFSAWANSSGITTKETYQVAKHNLLSSIKESGNLDAICLYLHGASVAEDTDDIEGDIFINIKESS